MGAQSLDLKEAIAAARDQGWEVLEHSGKVEFRPPDGSRPITTSGLAGRSEHGPSFVTHLRRAGLDLSRPAPKPKEKTVAASPASIPAAPPTDEGRAIGTLLEMLDELAGQFTTFRKHAQEEQMRMRADIQSQGDQIKALKTALDKALDGAQSNNAERDRQMAELRQMVANAARNTVDPLEAFRKRLS